MSAELRIIEPPEHIFGARRELPAGSRWRHPEHDRDGRACWMIVLPNEAGVWETTMATGSPPTMWDVTGVPPKITVSPSIDCRSGESRWHGFIRAGRLVEA